MHVQTQKYKLLTHHKKSVYGGTIKAELMLTAVNTNIVRQLKGYLYFSTNIFNYRFLKESYFKTKIKSGWTDKIGRKN